MGNPRQPIRVSDYRLLCSFLFLPLYFGVMSSTINIGRGEVRKPNGGLVYPRCRLEWKRVNRVEGGAGRGGGRRLWKRVNRVDGV